MTVQVGISCKLYENTGTWATPTWTERTTVQDVQVTDNGTAAEASNRATSIKTYLYGMTDWTLTTSLLRDVADAFYEAIRDAKRNKTTIEIAVMSGDITTTGEDGYRADWMVQDFDDNEPMDDANVVEATLKPAKTSNVPVYMDIA